MRKMEFQGHFRSDWSPYFFHPPKVEIDESATHHLLGGELKNSCASLENHSDPCCGLWANAEQTRATGCTLSRSFAMDARMRLESLKSVCSSPLPCCAMDGMLFNNDGYKCEKESEEPSEVESALDSVDLLDVQEEEEEDAENWLNKSRKQQALEERAESAVGWCRHVLDNPSPEMEEARRRLNNKLDKRSISDFYSHPAVFSGTTKVPMVPSVDKTPVSAEHYSANNLANNELNNYNNDSITSSYRLQDMTDVHIMARIQEASLREDFGCLPDTAASTRRGPQASSYSNMAGGNNENFPPPGLSSPRLVAKQGCQSPKLARLQQQVTQFKLLKLAQNQAAASPDRSRSTLQTSLRSLQAVRNSRSMEMDVCQPADQATQPPTVSPGAPSVRQGWNCRSPVSTIPNVLLHSAKKQQRSQSASPRRAPHPAKAYLSAHGRVFASPDRSTTVAWGRNLLSTQR